MLGNFKLPDFKKPSIGFFVIAIVFLIVTVPLKLSLAEIMIGVFAFTISGTIVYFIEFYAKHSSESKQKKTDHIIRTREMGLEHTLKEVSEGKKVRFVQEPLK